MQLKGGGDGDRFREISLLPVSAAFPWRPCPRHLPPHLPHAGLTYIAALSASLCFTQDQVLALTSGGIAAGFLGSSQTDSERKKVMQQLNNGELRLLYVTPEYIVGNSRVLVEGMSAFCYQDGPEGLRGHIQFEATRRHIRQNQ